MLSSGAGSHLLTNHGVHSGVLVLEVGGARAGVGGEEVVLVLHADTSQCSKQ